MNRKYFHSILKIIKTFSIIFSRHKRIVEKIKKFVTGNLIYLRVEQQGEKESKQKAILAGDRHRIFKFSFFQHKVEPTCYGTLFNSEFYADFILDKNTSIFAIIFSS